MTRVVVIGGGASGVLVAAHLLRADRPGLTVTIVEQRDELGAGIAYATKDPDHFLNVRASNMSAFSDEPDHFARWLRQTTPQTGRAPADGDAFAPRRLYRAYLSSLVAPHLAAGRLNLAKGQAVAILESDTAVTVALANGGHCTADRAVLATGNEGPRLPPARWRHDGWASGRAPELPADAPILIVGTGLTMVDWVLTLLHSGHRGTITAVSPRGLIPHAHRATTAVQLDATRIPFGAPLCPAIRWMRDEISRVEHEGGDWRSVIDAVRPYTARLWQALPLADKRRFMRHVRPWWDQHRHRVAPNAAGKLQAAEARGQLRIVAARVLDFEERADGVEVVVADRGTQGRKLFARAVFECRGGAGDVEKTSNPMLRSLLATGQARPDSLRLGLDVDPHFALVDREGRASRTLHALGPVTAGVFWEVTAVPDIRVQAAQLARTLLAAA